MKTMMKTTLMATSLVMALTACGSKKENKQPDPNKPLQMTIPQGQGSNSGTSPETKKEGQGPKAEGDQTSQQPVVQQPEVSLDSKPVTTAEGLADAAEQLIGPYTFMLADKVFDSALQADPNNKKAQFYKAFLKRMMVFKGIATRIRPMVRAEGSSETHEKTIREFPNSPLKDFLLDGKEDISSVSQVQDLVANYTAALNDFRKFLKLNPTLELTLNMNPHVFQKEIESRMSENCNVISAPDNNYSVSCDFSTIAQRKVNSADLVALGQLTGGEMLYWSMMNAYDLTVINDLGKDKSFELKTPQEKLEALKALPSVAKLRKDQTMSLIPELGADISAAVKWAMKYQKELCVNGDDGRVNRKGFLFDKGVCIQNITETQRSLAQLDQMLQGAVKLDVQNAKGEVFKMNVDIFGFLKTPPQDLKQLLPEAVNEEGTTRFGADKTLGGLLPDGDADRLTVK